MWHLIGQSPTLSFLQNFRFRRIRDERWSSSAAHTHTCGPLKTVHITATETNMTHQLLLIAFFMTVTALTSGEYVSTFPQSHVNSVTTPPTSIAGTADNGTTTMSTTNSSTSTHNGTTIILTTHGFNSTTPAINTTTPNYNTTTAPPTTPLPRPTPPANTTEGNYNVTDLDRKTCILAHFAIEIKVNNSQVNGTFIVQPNKTNASGSCDESIHVASMFLTFKEGSIVLKFRNNVTSKMVYVETLEYDLTYAFKSGVSKDYSGKNESLQLFAAAAGHSYSCTALTVFMGAGVRLDFTANRVQAFNIKNSEFGKPDLCKADQPDYRVPIAVAIILIILIVIVVIAYCVSRKRRTDGYQSL